MRVNPGRMPNARSLRQRENFTGEVWADPLLIGPGEAEVNNVLFLPSARTHWHRHDGGQILHAVAGRGRVCSRTGGGAPLRPGDLAWIEPGEEHWHGADPDSYLLHTAFSLGGMTWLHPVTDEEYGAFDQFE